MTTGKNAWLTVLGVVIGVLFAVMGHIAGVRHSQRSGRTRARGGGDLEYLLRQHHRDCDADRGSVRRIEPGREVISAGCGPW